MNLLPLPERLDTSAHEVTLDKDGLSENTYPLKMTFNEIETEYTEGEMMGNLILAKLASEWEIIEDIHSPLPDKSKWFMIGESEPNGINYFEHTYGVSVNDKVEESLIEYLGIRENVYYDYGFYSLKFKNESKSIVLKLTQCFPDEQYPFELKLPKNMARFPEEGRHINDPQLKHFRDIYTLCKLTGDKDKERLEDFFQVPVPFYGNQEEYLYLGILFDIEKNQVAKVKQYYYPNKSIHQIVREMNYVSRDIKRLLE